MDWIILRSRRAPAFWAPVAVILLIVVPLGVATQLWVANEVQELRALSASDPRAAAVAAERILRSSSWALCGFLVLTSALLARYVQLGLRQGRLPPEGWWSLGAHRAATGGTARRLGRAGLALALILVLAGISMVFLVDHLIETVHAA